MNWIRQFPGLSSLSTDEQDLLVANSTVKILARNTLVFGAGKTPDHLLLLLEGTVRVQQLSAQGREIVLYRVHAGESCVLTSACMLALEEYSAEGIAETDVRAVAIPLKTFDQLVSESTSFRHFVFSAYSKRIVELFHIIDHVVFQRVDIRLAEKILELAEGETQLHLTHQQLAAELGTAREVVSRQLAEFQRRQWVKQSRGAIEILDRCSLKQFISSNAN